jgi:hypothetical protein
MPIAGFRSTSSFAAPNTANMRVVKDIVIMCDYKEQQQAKHQNGILRPRSGWGTANDRGASCRDN